MSKTHMTYTGEFKLQAVRMVTDQHLAVAEVARRLGVPEGQLHDWCKAFRTRGPDAFPGQGRLAPHDEELHRLRAEVQRLKAERVIPKKSRRLLRQPLELTFAFIADHRGQWPFLGCATPWRFRASATTPGANGQPARPNGDDTNWSPP
jgi:transposase